MELLACIRVLKWIRESGPWESVTRVQVFTDSQYVKDNMIRAREWKKNDWRNQHGEPRENADLWKQLISAHSKTGITVHFEWTQGKTSPVLKRVDKAAKAAATRGGPDVDRGYKPGTIARSMVLGAAIRFPARGQSIVIRPYRKNLLGDGEEKVRFDILSEESQTYLESCYAFATTALAAELQVRGSKHAWTVRMISADALAKLVALKENSELDSVGKIHELLIPFEYTKLDKIIEIAFTVAEDATAALKEEQAGESETLPSETEAAKQHHTSPEAISLLRSNIVRSLSSAYPPLVKKSRALYWSADKTLRVAVTISKQYGDGGYWYAYHSDWDSFLGEASQGLYVLGCIGRDEAYMLPYQWIHSRIGYLNVTEREDNAHFHILLYPTTSGSVALRLNNGQNEPLDKFKLALSRSSVVSSAK